MRAESDQQVAYLMQWEVRGLYVWYEGYVTSGELLEVAQTWQGDERFDDLRYILQDFSGAETITRDVETMKFLAANDSAAKISNARIRLAVFPNRPDVINLVQAYLGAGMRTWTIRVFPTREAARAWVASPFTAA